MNNSISDKTKIKWIAFDVDGTLFESKNILVPAYQIGIDYFHSTFPNERRLITPSLEEILSLVGQPNKAIISTLFPELNQEHAKVLGNKIVDSLSTLIKDGKGEVYDGVLSTIEELRNKGYRLLAASNGKCEYINSIMEYYNLMGSFEQPILTIEKDKLSSKGEILATYIQRYNIKSDELIMIGDRLSDLQAAEHVNCKFIGCIYGNGHESELSHVEYKVNDFKLIKEIIKSL